MCFFYVVQARTNERVAKEKRQKQNAETSQQSTSSKLEALELSTTQSMTNAAVGENPQS